MNLRMSSVPLELSGGKNQIPSVRTTIFHLSNVHFSMCSVWVARRPPGYAFLDFEDPRDARDAIRDVDGNTFIFFQLCFILFRS